uniref:EF-hand domain-containing protein n=1 Tax=Globisporangium ultimum (strain ATCC 200006 / CBS 805.95 / DAOM BR144) TaxID=431595 RepID=K3X241_GLOUD
MLKRIVKEATKAASSGTESSRRQKRREAAAARRREADSSSDAEAETRNRRIRRKHESEREDVSSNSSAHVRHKTTTEKKKRQGESSSSRENSNRGGRRNDAGATTSSTDTPRTTKNTNRFTKNLQNKLKRMWNAGKMKRTPLLESVTIEAVYSAMHGRDKKRARTKLLEMFVRYGNEETGRIGEARFTKCITKVGIYFKKSSEYDALVHCFSGYAKGADDDDDESTGSSSGATRKKPKMVDYIAFTDFACNVRDSEKLSAIADKLRSAIANYDDKHNQSTSEPYNIFVDLKKLDKKQLQWIPSEKFSAFVEEHERPVFKLSGKEIQVLVERFEYEYGKEELGVDYKQFAQWLQPMLHLDIRELHRRVQELVVKAHGHGGWDLVEMFEAMDEDGNGESDLTSSAESDGCSSSQSSGLDMEQLRRIKKGSQSRVWDEGGQGVDGDTEEQHGEEDQNDTIEKKELNHVLRALGHEFTTDELDAEMARADLDQNGRLDFQEFVAFVKRQLVQKQFLLSKQREMEIRQAFQSLDNDKNGVLDEKEFEYLIYKVLGVELSVEEQDALLDFVDENGDGNINEDEFIAFMKVMEEFCKSQGGKAKRSRFLASLDGTSKLALSAMKKLVRGAPIDLDKNLLMFFGVPTNFRPAISSASTCRALQDNTLERALSFPSPQMIVVLAQDPTQKVSDKKDGARFALTVKKDDDPSDEGFLLQQGESWQSHAVVSLKRAAGVPKPFDTREEDVLKRCVHVCLFQEQEEMHPKPVRSRRKKEHKQPATGGGTVVGNVHEIPVFWHPGEEDVWEFSKKATKQNKYKFLVRTNTVNDHLYLLVEFIVHLRMAKREKRRKRGKRKHASSDRTREATADDGDARSETREMVCCWCKIPIRTLLARRADIFRVQQKLWGGTAHSPVDIEQDEILRRRTGWRALTNAFKQPSPPAMGIKSVPVGKLPEELQKCIVKMPPTIIAPFVSLPILAEYMALMNNMLSVISNSSAGEA